MSIIEEKSLQQKDKIKRKGKKEKEKKEKPKDVGHFLVSKVSKKALGVNGLNKQTLIDVPISLEFHTFFSMLNAACALLIIVVFMLVSVVHYSSQIGKRLNFLQFLPRVTGSLVPALILKISVFFSLSFIPTGTEA